MSDESGSTESGVEGHGIDRSRPSYAAVFLPRCADHPLLSLIPALLCVGAAIGLVIKGEITKTPPSSLEGILLAACTPVGLALLWKATSDGLRRRRNRLDERQLDQLADPSWRLSIEASRGLAAARWCRLDSTLLPMTQRRTWKRLRGALDSLQSTHPAALVDHRLHEVCLGIERTENMLEPELLDSRISRSGVPSLRRSFVGQMIALLILGGTCIGVRSRGSNPKHSLAMLLAMLILYAPILAFMVLWPLIRTALPRLRSAPIAGMGTVIDGRGRKWTVNDSILLIEPKEEAIVAGLYGPAGTLRMSFYKEGDDGFEALWQRWMHPSPRTEQSLSE